MEASGFKQRMEKIMELLSSSDGPSPNIGVGYFIQDVTKLIEEWEDDEHPCSM